MLIKLRYLFLMMLLSGAITGSAQIPDTTVSFYTDSASVRMFQNPDISLLLTRPAGKGIKEGKARGYRVQIYSGDDRDRARNIQAEFMRQHQGMGVYLSYNRPHFQIRAGDFLKRSEAQELYQSLQGKYICIIVQDIINVRAKPNTDND